MYHYKNKEQNVDNFVQGMLNRTLSMFHYEGLPDTIPHEELEKQLQMSGYTIVFKAGNDLYCNVGGLSGAELDPYNRPTKSILNVPSLHFNETVDLNSNAVLMKNDSLQMGLKFIYEKYGVMFTENEITMILTGYNKRIETLLSGSDDQTIESAKKYLQKIINGDLGIIGTSKMFDGIQVNPASSSNTTKFDDLIEYHQYLKASVYNEIGMQANVNLKKERLISKEIDMNTDNIQSLINNMLNCRQVAIEKINELFGTNATVEFTSVWNKGEQEHDKETQENEEAQENHDPNSNNDISTNSNNVDPNSNINDSRGSDTFTVEKWRDIDMELIQNETMQKLNEIFHNTYVQNELTEDEALDQIKDLFTEPEQQEEPEEQEKPEERKEGEQ